MKVHVRHLWKNFFHPGMDLNIELFGLTIFELCSLFGHDIRIVIFNFMIEFVWGQKR